MSCIKRYLEDYLYDNIDNMTDDDIMELLDISREMASEVRWLFTHKCPETES